ncbi:MAG: methionyl-tRNA formyltransferase [Vicinamibacterales bacterium]
MSGSSLRIAFFGTPEFAVPTLQALLEARHEVVAVVSQPDRPKGRGHKLQPTPTKMTAAESGATVLQPERIRNDEFLRQVAEMQLDLGVVAAYGRILPESLLRLPRLGMINVHASLLPEYRGAAPVHRAVIDGRTETGVTIMRVVRELDAGPMMATTGVAIGPDETSVEIERKLAHLGAPLLLSVVDALAAGVAQEIPQDDSRATFAPKIVKSEGAIDWELPASRIHNLVRGLHPWPLVSAWIDGHRYLIHRTRRTSERSAMGGGIIVTTEGGRVGVATSDGEVLNIIAIQPEGRRVMTAREFLAGHPLPVGARLRSA